jgi:phosphoribosylanthranilate isomerase
MAHALARQAELVLAGGLDARNVGEAIRAVRPFGVDVSSGVESAPGVKSPARIRDFVQAARAAGLECQR